MPLTKTKFNLYLSLRSQKNNCWFNLSNSRFWAYNKQLCKKFIWLFSVVFLTKVMYSSIMLSLLRGSETFLVHSWNKISAWGKWLQEIIIGKEVWSKIKNLALLKTDLSPKEVILALLIKHLSKLSCENSSSTRAVFN